MKNNKMKILIPILKFGKAGGYRVLSELANNWTENGHEVDFVSYFESDKSYYPTKAKVIWLNNNGEEITNNVDYISKGSTRNKIHALSTYIRKNSKEYDVILANFNLTTISVMLFSKTNNYYYIQAYEPDFFPIRSFKSCMHKFIAWLTYFLPLTKVVNSDIYKHYKNIRSKYVIPPGLDLKIYYPKKLEYKNKDEIVVGCIGRKEEFKGSEDVAAAVKILHEKGYKIKFKVAFNPVNYKNYELVHPDGDNNLADFYRSLDILVAPGHIQLGAVHYPVMEAMACNVPVITTGYYPANNENSFIVPVKRPDKISEIIEMIAKDYSITIKKATKAREDIQQFDWKIVSNKFIEIFEQTMSVKN